MARESEKEVNRMAPEVEKLLFKQSYSDLAARIRTDARLRRALDLIESRDNELRATVPAMAKAAGLSRTTFHELFRCKTGLTPHQFVRRLRIMRASQLMRSIRMTMLEIALEAGFGDEGTMRRNFKEMVGIIPGQWRKFSRHA
jgi:AraC family transcriptional regulator